MCSVKERIRTYLRVCIDEMDLIEKMSVSIESPEDFDGIQSLWDEPSIYYRKLYQNKE